MEFIRHDVCVDCFFFVVNDEEPEDSTDWSAQETREAMQREAGNTGGHFACGVPPKEEDEEEEEGDEEDGYTDFTWQACELCRSTLGGSRYALTLCIPDKPTV